MPEKQKSKSKAESILEDILRGNNFKKIILILIVLGVISIPAAIAYRLATAPIQYKDKNIDVKVQSVAPKIK